MQLANKIGEDAKMTPKITTIEQNLSNLKINEDLATKRLTKLEQQVEGEIRTMTGEIKTLKSGIEKESKNRLQLANKIGEDAQMTPRSPPLSKTFPGLSYRWLLLLRGLATWKTTCRRIRTQPLLTD